MQYTIDASFWHWLEKLRENKDTDPSIKEVYEALICYIGELFCSGIEEEKLSDYKFEAELLTKFLIRLSLPLKNLGKLEQAENLLETAFFIIKGQNRQKAASVLVKLAAVHKCLEHLREADKRINKAIAIYKDLPSSSRHKYASALLSSAEISCNRNDTKRLIKEAQPIIEEYYGLEHLEIARVYVSLMFHKMCENSEYVELLNRSLNIFEKECIKEHFFIDQMLRLLIETLNRSPILNCEKVFFGNVF